MHEPEKRQDFWGPGGEDGYVPTWKQRGYVSPSTRASIPWIVTLALVISGIVVPVWGVILLVLWGLKAMFPAQHPRRRR